jgi:shikimate dehydrogenase
VLDLVYVRHRTRFVQAARAAGMAAEDGRGVLIAQGAASFRRFFGVEAPLEVMRAAVEEVLGG